MADLQISQLPSIASGSVAGAVDCVALADISASQTAKLTVKDLVTAGVGSVSAGTIPATALSYPLSANSIVTATLLDANVTNAKLQYSSISLGGLTLALGSTDSTPALNLVDAINYPTSSLSGTITNAQLAGSIAGTKLSDTTVTYSKLNISDGDIPGAKITSASLTATQLGTDSVTATQIAANAVGASEIGSAVITNAHISSNTIEAGNIAANAIGSSELADNSVDAAALQTDSVITIKIQNSAVTNDKLAGSITGSKLTSGTITSTQLGINSVTSVELADNAVDSAAIANLAVIDAKISAVLGTKITDATITAAKLNTSNIDRSLNVASGNLGINNAVTGGASARNGITYNAQGLITATAALVASDLPEATVSAVGAVSIPSAGGLSVTNLGAVSITNSVTAATRSGITYNANGLITGAVALVAADMPLATTTAVGAMSVPTASAPLAVSGAGVLSLADSGSGTGTFTKVTVSAKGVVTTGASLAATDIPVLDASKITTGSLATARIADDAVTMDKIGSNAISFIQEAMPDISDLPTGVYWLQESTGQLRIFNGNSWFSVGFGRLAEENLRFCGTFNATNGIIVTLTTFGTSAGFSAGNAIPAGTASTTGAYFVCTVPGNGTAVVPSTSFDAGDWAMCIGLNDWDRVDTLSGPGSVSALDDLSDVTIASPTAGQFFEYASDGQWKNVSVISGGTY